MLGDRVRAVLERLEREDAAERAQGLPQAVRARQVAPTTGRFLFSLVAPQTDCEVLELGGGAGEKGHPALRDRASRADRPADHLVQLLGRGLDDEGRDRRQTLGPRADLTLDCRRDRLDVRATVEPDRIADGLRRTGGRERAGRNSGEDLIGKSEMGKRHGASSRHRRSESRVKRLSRFAPKRRAFEKLGALTYADERLT